MAVIDRTGAGSLIPEDYVGELIKAVQVESAVLRAFRHVKMKAKVQRQSVLAGLATAGFVSPADIGFKPTSSVSWANKTITAEAVACIVPIPEEVMDDTGLDWNDIKPYMAEAMAVAIDDAVLFGTNAPATWGVAGGVVAAAVAAGNQVIAGTSAVDVFDDVNAAMALMEADGFYTDAEIGRIQWRAKLRGARDTQKGFLFPPTGPENTGIGTQRGWPGKADASIMGEPVYFSRAGFSNFATGAAFYSLIGLESDQFVVGIRQDMTYKLLDQATLYQADGTTIMYQLAQQDMVALRVVMRLGWVCANPVNRLQAVEANRYPAWVLKQKAATGGE
jgi:HK97 family phage major capsid protein